MAQRGRKLDIPKDLQIVCAHASQKCDRVRVGAAETVKHSHGNREKGCQYDQRDLRRDAEAHPEHKNRCNGDGRNRLRYNKQRIDRVVEQGKPVHKRGSDERQYNADAETCRCFRKRRCRMCHHGGKIIDKGSCNVRRRGKHIGGHRFKAARRRPENDQQRDGEERRKLIGDAL